MMVTANRKAKGHHPKPKDDGLSSFKALLWSEPAGSRSIQEMRIGGPVQKSKA